MNSRAQKSSTVLLTKIPLLLSCLWLQGCSPATDDKGLTLSEHDAVGVQLSFQPAFGEQELKCDSEIQMSSRSWRIEQLALFMSNVEIQSDQNKTWQPVSLLPSPWQTKDVGLLWFDTQCASNSTSNAQLNLDLDAEQWQPIGSLRFELAVPFELNHLNPLTQPSPLNLPDMFWSWRMGYKFIRLDMTTTDEQAPKAWSYHLGSVGCESASTLRPPQQTCAKPNRFTIEVPIDKNARAFRIDLGQLLTGVDIGTLSGCMFHTDAENSCEMLSRNLQQQAIVQTTAAE